MIEASIGEIVDKYSILEIKMKRISNEHKLNDIKNEMKCLESYVVDIINTHFYKMLIYINTLIWDDTDYVKDIFKRFDETNLELLLEHSKGATRIYENNQKRFRIKSLLNERYNSKIKEHKSYAEEKCYIQINRVDEIYEKIPEINYLCINYDRVYINPSHKENINFLFSNYNISFSEIIEANIPVYNLSVFEISNDIKDVFDFEPIPYISGGLLGDFFNQLSVVCENYYKHGRKGILYIANIGDNFAFGLNRAYDDTYQVISKQKYIKEYKIYNDEKVDINLSSWRVKNLWKNWNIIFNSEYNVDWGKHKWIEHNKTDDKWKNKIIINNSIRPLSKNAITQIKNKIKDEVDVCVFVSNEKKYYDDFCLKSNLNIEYYMPIDLDEVVTIMNSCKMSYLGFSSMAVIANSLHKPHYLIGQPGAACILNSIEGIIPHVLGIYV
jgi:hypothetical protein